MIGERERGWLTWKRVVETEQEGYVMSDEKIVTKPVWLSKTNWGVVVAVLSVVLGHFGVSSDWLTQLAASIGIEPVTLSVSLMAALNVIMKVVTWLFFKFIVKK